MAACRNGHPVPGDAAFCGACGDDVRPRCRHGHPNRPGVLACVTCGARVLAGADSSFGAGPAEPAPGRLADGYAPPDYPPMSYSPYPVTGAPDDPSAGYPPADYPPADYQPADYPPPGYPAPSPGGESPVRGAEPITTADLVAEPSTPGPTRGPVPPTQVLPPVPRSSAPSAWPHEQPTTVASAAGDHPTMWLPPTAAGPPDYDDTSDWSPPGFYADRPPARPGRPGGLVGGQIPRWLIVTAVLVVLIAVTGAALLLLGSGGGHSARPALPPVTASAAATSTPSAAPSATASATPTPSPSPVST